MEQFKAGDWVVELCPDVDDYCKPKPSGKPKQIKKIKQGNTGLLYSLVSDTYKRWLGQKDIIHWKPKVDDWVIPDTGVNEDMFVVMKYNGVSLIPARCEPFVGKLPHKLKDLK